MFSPSRLSTPAAASDDDDNASSPTTILSPRSKIRAMLARIDADSEDEEQDTNTMTSNPLVPKRREKDAFVQKEKDNDDNDNNDGDDEEPIVKPRGRLAARMGATSVPFQKERASSEEGEEPDNVYQRIRREMLAEKTEKLDLKPSPPARSESPGLFMSPGPARVERRNTNDNSNNDSDSDSDLPDSDKMQARLRELVERRRRERLAKEAKEREAEAERAEQTTGGAPLSDLFDDEEDVDKVAEKKLTQQTRPTRKASKKALEEMNRETQRMSRNMQLTHLAKTKKKFTVADFLTRFGGAGSSKTQTPLAQVTTAPDSSSITAQESDVDRLDQTHSQDTPPSSPPSIQGKLGLDKSDDEDLLEPAELGSSQHLAQIDKGKGLTQPQSPKKSEQTKATKKKFSPRQYRIVPPPRPTQDASALDDSDSDIEIVQSDRVSAIFSSVGPSKAAESRPLHVLRHLAHLNHSEKPRLKKGERPSLTPAQLEIELRRRAKLQAIREREEKIANLKAKGIVIMTEEEREKEQVFIENMLERAREEAEELRKKEKKAAKEAGLNEDDMLASSDESEDDDYTGSGAEDEIELAEDDVADDDVELSGSEEEGEEDAEVEGNEFVDSEAGEDDDAIGQDNAEHEAKEIGEAMDLDQENGPTQVPVRRARIKRVVEDDDEDEDTNQASSQKTLSTNANDSINDDLAAAFGFGTAAPALRVSQMFAGTMADTQDSMDVTTPRDSAPIPEQDSFDMLRQIPSAPVPTFTPTADTLSSQDDSIVVDSQTLNDSMRDINLHSSQLQQTPTLDRMDSMSQFGDLDFTPSQDIGMRDQTPLRLHPRAQSHTTQDTVLMDVPESPVVQQAQRRGHFVRRVAPAESDSENEAVTVTPVQSKVDTSNAFDRLRKGATKAQRADFDKKASEARRMVDEQAEESEDEYAGLGGASDDEQVDEEENEADKAMIDESDIAVNERELAALYAEKARNQDEVQTSKLYKDLMSGAMRRRRGAGGAFDLDSDEDEQVAERRRRKQREEARKRRLLLQDESVGRLGANEKKEAFLRAIEDRDEDDDMDDLLDGHDVNEDDVLPEDSQDQQVERNGEGSTQPLAESSANVLKRKAANAIPSSQEASNPPLPAKRSRPSMRRNPLEAFRAPRSLQEVRDSVSFLIEDAHIDPEANGTMFSDDDEDDEFSHNAGQPRAPANERRTQPKTDIIDRLTLKKQSSSSLAAVDSTTDSNDGTVAAFATAGGNSGNSSFSKLPSLLRRATTSASAAGSMPPPLLPASASFRRQDSTSSVGSNNSTSSTGGSSNGGLRMGGSKKSSINYQAREAERKIVIERAERARRENLKRIAGLRRVSGGKERGKGKGTGNGTVAGGMFGGGVSAGSGFE